MLTGSCLCGSISISVTGNLEHSPEACHCVQCRKQTGTFLTSVNVRKTALTIEGKEYICWYQSSDKVKRGFCAVCGSPLFWKPDLEGYQWISIAMGLFDQSTGMKLSKHTFVDQKGDYYELNDGLPQSNSY